MNKREFLKLTAALPAIKVLPLCRVTLDPEFDKKSDAGVVAVIAKHDASAMSYEMENMHLSPGQKMIIYFDKGQLCIDSLQAD